jgi:dipeptidyl-peptidase 4
MKKLFFLTALFFTQLVLAQKQISIDDFTTRNTFAQKTVSGIKWMSNGKFYTSIDNNKIIKYDITTGQAVETIVDGSGLNITIQNYGMSDDEKKLLLNTESESIYRRSSKAEYYVYDLATKSLKKLSSGGKQSYATFSPDGSAVAF